jgi:Flp pilus assembly protein TadD
MTSMLNRYNDNKAADFSQILELVREQKLGEAINKLKRMTELDKKNLKAQTLLEHLEK